MLTILIDGRPFLLLGEEPYTRKDGAETSLYHWRKHCSHPGCPVYWEFRSPTRDKEGALRLPAAPAEWARASPSLFGRDQCKRHRPRLLPRTRRKTKPSTYASRTRVSAEEVAALRAQALELFAQGVPRMQVYQALSLVTPFTPATLREVVAGRKRA